MSSVINKTTLEYLKSVNTPDYPESDWIVDPDMSGVEGVPQIYWKLVGDVPTEMTQSEKDQKDADMLQARKDSVTIGYSEMKSVMTALIKVINLRLPSNKITAQEMVDAIKNEIT